MLINIEKNTCTYKKNKYIALHKHAIWYVIHSIKKSIILCDVCYCNLLHLISFSEVLFFSFRQGYLQKNPSFSPNTLQERVSALGLGQHSSYYDNNWKPFFSKFGKNKSSFYFGSNNDLQSMNSPNFITKPGGFGIQRQRLSLSSSPMSINDKSIQPDFAVSQYLQHS